jgi:hypothetical protein
MRAVYILSPPTNAFHRKRLDASLRSPLIPARYLPVALNKTEDDRDAKPGADTVAVTNDVHRRVTESNRYQHETDAKHDHFEPFLLSLTASVANVLIFLLAYASRVRSAWIEISCSSLTICDSGACCIELVSHSSTSRFSFSDSSRTDRDPSSRPRVTNSTNSARALSPRSAQRSLKALRSRNARYRFDFRSPVGEYSCETYSGEWPIAFAIAV